MAKPPRTPRAAKRTTAFVNPSIAGRAIVPKPVDPRQPDLFAVSFIPPCKPKLVMKVPVGERWQYEVKHDGYRAQCHVADGHVRIYTKNGHDITSPLSAIVRDLIALPGLSAVIDGEAVMVDQDGVSDFFLLHAAMARKQAPDAVLLAFDLLSLNGEDLRAKPLAERRTMLVELLIGAGPAIHLSEHSLGDGPELLTAACRLGLEGIVAKRRDAPYRSGYQDAWLKVKCTKVGQFAIVGFDAEGRTGVRALKLAQLVKGKLSRCGSVGSGITRDMSGKLRELLDGGSYLVADVEYRGMSPAGELRHPVLKGWHGEN